jgi:hypothetical protein
LIHYSKPFELLHDERSSLARGWNAAWHFSEKRRDFAYNVMHLWHIKSL